MQSCIICEAIVDDIQLPPEGDRGAVRRFEPARHVSEEVGLHVFIWQIGNVPINGLRSGKRFFSSSEIKARKDAEGKG